MRTIASGIRPHYQAEDLQGDHVPINTTMHPINGKPHPINTRCEYNPIVSQGEKYVY